MSTLRQIEANRRNAQKSTGPTSVTGKATSSMNALKTGIHAKSLVLPSEKLADLELLIDEYYQHHNPASPEARALLEDLIRCEWLQRRLHTAETQFWAFDNKDAWTPDNQYPLGQTVSRRSKAFGQLQWRINCTRRAVPGQCAAGGQFGESAFQPSAVCARAIRQLSANRMFIFHRSHRYTDKRI